jgi:hypothetical protein
LDKFFITTLVAGLVVFSSVLAISTQMAQAVISEKKTVRLVVIQRMAELQVPGHTGEQATVNCNSDEVVTGGGFFIPGFVPITNGGVVTMSQKTSNGWVVQASNNGDDTLVGRAFAECAHLEL